MAGGCDLVGQDSKRGTGTGDSKRGTGTGDSKRGTGTGDGASPPFAGALEASCLVQIGDRRIVWLWGEMVARGMVTLLTGASGVGKSFVGLDVAAAVTRGDRRILRQAADDTAEPAAPADPRAAGDVLLISPEYELVDVRPRLEAAGAEMSRVHALRGVRRQEPKSDTNSLGMFQLNRNLLEQEIEMRKAAGSPLRLIVIDPFPLELFDDRAGARELTSTIEQLAEIAARTEIAVLVIVNCPVQPRPRLLRHLRAIESIVQLAWWISRGLARPERRLLLPLKMNLVEKPPGRAYWLNDGRVQWDPDPVWRTADEFHAAVIERTRKPLLQQEWSELARATYWLREYMQFNALEYQDIKEAANFHGIGERTLRRAFCGMKGLSWRIPGSNNWAWKLRENPVVEPQFPPGIERLLVQEGEAAEAEG